MRARSTPNGFSARVFRGGRKVLLPRLLSATFPLLLCFSSCALPKSDNSVDSFIPPNERVIVSLVREGLSLFSRGRYLDALMRFEQAYYLDSNTRNISLNLASARVRNGIYDGAEKLYEMLLLEEPEDLDVLNALARLAYSKGDFDEARAKYQEIIELAREKTNMLSLRQAARSLSVLEFEQGDLEAALCSSYLSSNGGSPEEKVRHGRLLLALGEDGKADELASGLLGTLRDGASPDLLRLGAFTSFAVSDDERVRTLLEYLESRGETLGSDESLLQKFVDSSVSTPYGFLMQEVGPSDKKDQSDSEELSLKESLSEDEWEELLLEEYSLTDSALISLRRLYWPRRFLDEVVDYHERLAKELGVEPGEFPE